VCWRVTLLHSLALDSANQLTIARSGALPECCTAAPRRSSEMSGGGAPRLSSVRS
jgi:hypothetical protein